MKLDYLGIATVLPTKACQDFLAIRALSISSCERLLSLQIDKRLKIVKRQFLVSVFNLICLIGICTLSFRSWYLFHQVGITPHTRISDYFHPILNIIWVLCTEAEKIWENEVKSCFRLSMHMQHTNNWDVLIHNKESNSIPLPP